MNSETNQRVLVVGGAGFIGSNIVDALVEKGYKVGVLDSLVTGSKSNVSNLISENRITFHEGDITNHELVANTVKDYDAVIHEAALVSVTRSVENPQLTNSVNVDGTVNLLKASVDSKIQTFVYASSSSVYGDTETLPKKETMTTSPISPYGVSKLAAENYCRAFAKVYGLRTVSLRYFNVFGPRQKYGPYSGVIPTFIKKVAEDESPIIFGNGEQTRDFTFVDDVVQANLLALEKDVAPGEVFNIARGGTVTINELARMILKVMDKPKLKITHGPPRKGDIKASYADISKATKELGYSPKFSLEQGLAKVVEWFRAGNEF